MKNFSTWMLVIFMIMFWIFRIIVTLTSELNIDIGFVPLNSQMEIILLFVTLLSIILVVKRKIVGGLIYILSYGMYFGVDLSNNVMKLLEQSEIPVGMTIYTSTFVSLLAMILAVAVLLDLLVDKSRKVNPIDKKTDWFYKNEQYDRKLDERADKNNYRTM